MSKRSWKLGGAWGIYGDEGVTHTDVQILSNDGRCVITERMFGDWTKKDESDIINATIDQFVKKERTDLMTTEAVLKVDELSSVIADAKKDQKRYREEFKAMVSEVDVIKAELTSALNDIRALHNNTTELNESLMAIVSLNIADDIDINIEDDINWDGIILYETETEDEE